MVDPITTDLITVAGIVFGFGVVVIMFRIERELKMRDKGEQNWIAYSDYLVFASIGASIFIVLLPVLTVPAYRFIIPAARAGCVAAIILEAGYIPSILAHYRLGIGEHRTGGRDNPEPAERLLVRATVIISAVCFCATFLLAYVSLSRRAR